MRGGDFLRLIMERFIMFLLGEAVEETPKRPLAHATLSGSFVLISTLGVLSLVASVIVTTMGLFDSPQTVNVVSVTDPIVAKRPATNGEWRSLATAAQTISRKQAPTSAMAEPKPEPEPELDHSSTRQKRSFDDRFKRGVYSFLNSLTIDTHALAKAYLQYESYYSDTTAEMAAARVNRALQWLESTKGTATEKGVEHWLVALQTTLIGSQDILYNKYRNLAIMIAIIK